jgi:hypothetical protein
MCHETIGPTKTAMAATISEKIGTASLINRVAMLIA